MATDYNNNGTGTFGVYAELLGLAEILTGLADQAEDVDADVSSELVSRDRRIEALESQIAELENELREALEGTT